MNQLMMMIENGNTLSTAGYVSGGIVELSSDLDINGNLGKLLHDAEYDDYSDAEIIVEGISVGVNRCILASRSQFFHELFKNKSSADYAKDGKPRYLLAELVPYGKIGYETFMVLLNYLYTGKLKPSPPEVSTCVDGSCAHDACGPAIDCAVELMYASATFQMKEFIVFVQRCLLNFVNKALAEDIIPIILVAFHCQLNQLLSQCVHRIARSDLDDITLEKEIPREVCRDIKFLQKPFWQDLELHASQVDFLYDERIKKIHNALDSDNVELLKLLLDEYNITLDDAYALHYAAAYSNPKVVHEVLSLGNADLNLRNSRGYTVLHVAARRKDPSIIVGLLSKGASVTDSTIDGQTSNTICRRLTRPKDYNHSKMKKTNKDRLCIDLLEREMYRNLLACTVSISSILVGDTLVMRLSFLQNRVAFVQLLFPTEAKVAMEIASVDSISEFTGLTASRAFCGNLRELDLNEIPSEQVNRLQLLLQVLQKTVETGRRFFPNCSEVLDRLLEDEMQDNLPEELYVKKIRYLELKEQVMKAFYKDKAEINWVSFSPPSTCSSSTKGSVNINYRKRKTASSVYGQMPLTICQRLTQPKDCETTKQGQASNDGLRIEVFEREILTDTIASNKSMSSIIVADDLVTRPLHIENRVCGRFLEDDLEGMRIKEMRFVEIKDQEVKSFEKDKTKIHPTDLSLSSPSETDTLLLEKARKLLRGNNVINKRQNMGLEMTMVAFNLDNDEKGRTGLSSSSSSCSISSVNQDVRKRELC